MTGGTRASKSGSLLNDFEESAKPSRPARGGSMRSQVGSKTLIMGAVTGVALLLAAYVTWTSVSAWRNSPEAQARTFPVVDSETGKVIASFRSPKGDSFPFVNPDTGKRTLFPAEACFWTKDGKAKFPPTYVILNERMGKPGPTRCPDCGRVVKLYNPMPPDALMQTAWDEMQKKK